jgi:pimeloyl-ACP methyl ester carboxylesterase
MESSSTSAPVQSLRIRSSDGLELAGSRREGAGRGPEVLLAHGFGQTRQSWLATQERLAAAGHASLAWDMRGHGESARNPAGVDYCVDQFVADQAAAAGALSPLPILVGASMGGLCSLLAQDRAAPYRALVLVDVTPRWEAAGMQRIRSFMEAFPEGFSSFQQASDAIASYLPQRRERKTPGQLAALLRAGPVGRLHWHWDPRLLSQLFQGSESLQQAISQAAARVQVPVLLVSGGRSDLVSADTVAHFLQLVPHAQHVRLADATHMLAGDDNDAFIDTLLAFLRAQFPGATPASRTPASTASHSTGVPR